jgi:hypothetical protein
LQGLFQDVFDLVGSFSRHRALFGRQMGDVAEILGDKPFSSQILDRKGLKLICLRS